MAYRNGNYCAFYVEEPYLESNLGAHLKRDFRYYNLLRAWKGRDTSFPYIDSHDKNYNVRDGSDWEGTLKPRIHDRLRKSKNIILFLSSVTKNSRAIREEIDYGINTRGLPVIVVYPELTEVSDNFNLSTKTIMSYVADLWDVLPKFRDSLYRVPTLHLPPKKYLIRRALQDRGFMVASKREAGLYYY